MVSRLGPVSVCQFFVDEMSVNFLTVKFIKVKLAYGFKMFIMIKWFDLTSELNSIELKMLVFSHVLSCIKDSQTENRIRKVSHP